MENMPVSYVPHGDSPGSNDNIPPVSSAPRPGAGGFGRHRAGTDHATVPPRDGPTEPSASLIRPSLGVESNGFLRVTRVQLQLQRGAGTCLSKRVLAHARVWAWMPLAGNKTTQRVTL